MRVLDAADAVGVIPDRATVLFAGSGAGHLVPQAVITALADAFSRDGRPRDLTTVRVVGIGDFGDVGFSQLALPGLMRRTIGSNIGNEPRLGALVEQGAIEAWSLPQGVLSQLTREIAAGRPGLLTHVGLGTYVDPRFTGGRQGPATTSDLVQVVELAGREWLFYPAFPIDVAVIRASTADEDGNLTMEAEAMEGEVLSMAMAARNSGGTVIAQVGRLAARGTLPARDVRVPAGLVDVVVVDPGQRQTYATVYSPYYAGALRPPAARPAQPPAHDVRSVIARRALLEFRPGDVVNLGFGISQQIGAIADDEGIADQLILTVEQGVFGGVPASGPEAGAGVGYQALIPQSAMFDFYDGGGLDVASLSFAEVDAAGNVNVHAFPGRLRGPGGFPNISARTRRLCFVGTLTTGGLGVELAAGTIRIASEGATSKFVPEVREITFSGRLARERGQDVRYITERAVFALGTEGLELTEVAEGIDVRREVLDRLGFAPRVREPLATMDARLFRPGRMGLAADFARLSGAGR